MRVRYRLAVAFAGAALLLGSAYAVGTSDAFVRRMVRSVLARTFRGPAHFESAGFSFKQGLFVRGLEVLDPNDPTGPPAIVVDTLRADYGLFVLGEGPHLTEVVLEQPTVRVRRLPDGTLSVASLLEPVPQDAKSTMRPPTVRVERATLSFEDASLLVGGAIQLEGATARLVPTGDAWRIDLSGRTKELGELSARAFVAPDGSVSAGVDLPHIPLGPELFARLRTPGTSEASAVGGKGTVATHVEIAWGPGHDVMVAAKVQLAGVAASFRFPEREPGEPLPEPIEVRVTSGVAELKGGTLELTALEVLALGGTLNCPRATLSGLGTPAPSLDAEATIDDLVLGPPLVARLPFSARRVFDAFGIGGDVTATVTVKGPLAAPRVGVEALLAAGRLRFEGYPRADGVREGFPWDVRDLDAAVSFDGKRVRFTAKGRHGTATVSAEGGLDYASGDEIPEITIDARDVPLDADLRAGFQDRAEAAFDRWGPSGTAARIGVRVVRDPHADGPHGDATEVTLELDGRAAMRPRLLPAELTGIRGRIAVLAPSRGGHRAERVVLSDVSAHAEGLAIHVDGYVETDRAVATDDLVVEAKVADLGGATRQAVLQSTEFIPESVKHLLVDLGARGPASIRAAIAGDPDRRRDLVTVDLEGASVTGYRDVPFAAASITGRVVVDGDEARLEDVRAQSLGTSVRGAGRLLGLSGTLEPDVRIEASHLPLGSPLREALGPLAKPAAAFWEQLRPVGEAGTLGTRADVVVALRPSTDPTPVEIWLRDIRGPLVPLGLEFDNQGGELHYDGREAVMRLSASIGGAEIDLQRAHLDLVTHRLDWAADVRGLRFPEDVETLFGADTVARIRDAIPGRNVHWNHLEGVYDPTRNALDLKGELAIRPRSGRAGPPPGLAPDGAVNVSRMTFEFPPALPVTFDVEADATGFRAHPGIQVEEFTGPLRLTGRIDDDGLQMTVRTDGARLVAEGLVLSDAVIEATTTPRAPKVTASATFHGGRLTARLGPGAPGMAYAGQIHLRDADLASVAGAKAGVKGLLGGDSTFNNATGKIADLQGGLEMWVKDGDLVKFPLVSAILNVIPGAGDLTDGSLTAKLAGPGIEIRDVVIRGPILKVTGDRGTVTFDGRLDVLLSAFWGVPFASLPLRVAGTIRNPEVSVRILGGGAPRPADRPGEPEPSGTDDPRPRSDW